MGESRRGFITYEKKCEIHKNVPDNALFVTVQKHNQNLQFKDADIELEHEKRETERKRIKQLGNGIKDPELENEWKNMNKKRDSKPFEDILKRRGKI